MGAWKFFFPREFCWQDAAKNVDKPHEELLKSCEAQRAKVPFGRGELSHEKRAPWLFMVYRG